MSQQTNDLVRHWNGTSEYLEENGQVRRKSRRVAPFLLWTALTLLGVWLVVFRRDSTPLHLLGIPLVVIGDVGAFRYRWHSAWFSTAVLLTCLVSSLAHHPIAWLASLL